MSIPGVPEARGDAGAMAVLATAASSVLAAAVAVLAIRRPDAIPLQFSVVGIAALIGGVAFLFVVLRHTSIALPILVSLVYLNLSEVLVRNHGFPSVLQLVVFPLFVAAWLGGGSMAVPDVLRRPVTIWLLVLTAITAATSMWARDVELADRRIFETVKSLVIYLLVALLAASLRRLELAIYAIVASATLLSILPILQTAGLGFDSDFGGLARIKEAQIYGDVFQPRIAGPLGDPNFFAQILLIALPLAVFVARSTPSRALKFFGTGAAVAILLAILLSYSRGGMLSVLVMAAAALPATRIEWRKLAFVAALGLTVFVLMPQGVRERFVTIEEVIPGGDSTIDPDSSFEERRLLVGTPWAMFSDRPITGVGPGNYTEYFDEYAAFVGAVFRAYGDPNATQYPHNLYLEFGAEMGVFGLTAFLGAVAAFFIGTRRARAALAAAGLPHHAGLALAIEIAMLGYLVSSVFLHGAFQRYLWLLFALGLSVDLLARRGRVRESA